MSIYGDAMMMNRGWWANM